MPHQNSHKQYFRSIFLSDFHIGAKTFNAPALLDFLRKTESQSLYLVGDIIDGWKLHKRWYWNDYITEIFDELFRKSYSGTKIIYITGNHDEKVREFSLLKRLRYSRRFNFQIKNRIIHKTLDERDFLVIHGDQFDRAILQGRLSRWSDRFYDLLTTRLNKKLTINVNGTEKRFSLSKFLSYHGQIALNILNNFETALVREAKKSDVSGIICGHTHIPALKTIKNFTYANCGSWLKNSQNAIVETIEGKIEQINWQYEGIDENHPSLPFNITDMKKDLIYPESFKFRPLTERLISSIQRTWPSPHNYAEKHAEEEYFINLSLPA